MLLSENLLFPEKKAILSVQIVEPQNPQSASQNNDIY